MAPPSSGSGRGEGFAFKLTHKNTFFDMIVDMKILLTCFELKLYRDFLDT